MQALILAPLVTAAVLVLAAVGKLRAPAVETLPFEGLALPRWLYARPLVAAHPWVELAIGVALVVTPAPWTVLPAVAGLGLMVLYTVLVAFALWSGDRVSCQCFGADDRRPVGGRTLARNLVLTAVAAAAVGDAATGGSVVGRVVGGGAELAGWLAGAVLVAVVTTLTVGPAGPESAVGRPDDEEDAEAGLDDYLRTEIPAVRVRTPEGRDVDLRHLAAQRARLLVFVSPGCGSCAPITRDLPRWQARDLPLEVRAVVAENAMPHQDVPLWAENAYVDVDRAAWQAFGIRGTPSAVLLGTDGLLAGGPVSGATAVRDFYVRIAQQLAAAPVTQAN